MQCGILDWILKQKKDMSGKTGKFCIKSGVSLVASHQYQFLSFVSCVIAM